MAAPSYDQPRTDNQRLHAQLAHLERTVASLQATCDDLRRQLDDATRAGQRQAAQAHYVAELEALTARPRRNEANQRLADPLGVHGEQGLQSLGDVTLPATSWRPEQALRPAVVNRKVGGGNRTEAGAEAQGVLTSVLQTCRQQLLSGFEYIRGTLCHGFTSLFKSAPAAGR